MGENSFEEVLIVGEAYPGLMASRRYDFGGRFAMSWRNAAAPAPALSRDRSSYNRLESGTQRM